jgi:hypothetical protein
VIWFRKAAGQGDANAKIALEATQRLLILGPSPYQDAVFDGWQTVSSGTYATRQQLQRQTFTKTAP